MPGDWIFCQIRVIHGYTDSNLMPANRPVRSLRQGRGTDGAAPLVPLPHLACPRRAAAQFRGLLERTGQGDPERMS